MYQTERLLKDHPDPAAEEALSALQEALEEDDIEAIRLRTEALAAASEQICRRPYEHATSAPGDDDVVDAEFVDDRMSA